MELDKILPVARRGLLLAKGNHCFLCKVLPIPALCICKNQRYETIKIIRNLRHCTYASLLLHKGEGGSGL